jgi:hypothetical protein
LRVAYQDVPFTAPDTYLAAYLLPATTEGADIGGAHRAFVGVFQVSIITPAGKGRGAAEGIADEIAALFPKGLKLLRSGLIIHVQTPCSSVQPITDSTSSTLPVSFQYRADR